MKRKEKRGEKRRREKRKKRNNSLRTENAPSFPSS